MKADFKRVVESILSAEDEPVTCELHQRSIPAYVEAELDGRDVKTLYPELAKHLESCPDCHEEHGVLLQILDLERQGRLEEPARLGQFDFSFLKDLLPKPSLWDVKEANVRRLVADITAQFGAKLVTLASLSETLMPHRRLAPAFVLPRMKDLREPRSADLTEVLEFPDSEANICIKLFMGPVQNRHGVVMVQVEKLEPPGPLSRVRVTLRDQEMRLLESAPTALDGTVTFKELNVGQYVIEVRRNESRWELELSLEDQS